MSSKQTSEFIVQCETLDKDFTKGSDHWADWYNCETSDIHTAEAKLASTAENLNCRKPSRHTGRYRLVCRVTNVEDHQIGEVIDNR